MRGLLKSTTPTTSTSTVALGWPAVGLGWPSVGWPGYRVRTGKGSWRSSGAKLRHGRCRTVHRALRGCPEMMSA